MTIALTLTAAARQALTGSSGLQQLTITHMEMGSGSGTLPTTALRTRLIRAAVSGVQSSNDVVTVSATFKGVSGQVREIALFATGSGGSELMLASQTRASNSEPEFFSLSTSVSTVVTSVIAISGAQSGLSVAVSPKIEAVGPSHLTALSDTPSNYGQAGQLLLSSGSGVTWSHPSSLKRLFHYVPGRVLNYVYRSQYVVDSKVTKLQIECAGPGGGPSSSTVGGTTAIKRGATTLVSAAGGGFHGGSSRHGNGVVGGKKWHGRGGAGSPHVSGGYSGGNGGLAVSTITATPGETLTIEMGVVKAYSSGTSTQAAPGWVTIEGFTS